MPNNLEWSRAYTGRLEGKTADVSEERIEAFADTLAKATSGGMLPYLTMPWRSSLEQSLQNAMPLIRKYKHMIVLGIGGSALGARAIQRAFAPGQDGPMHDGPSLWIVDNVCAEEFESLLAKLPPSQTVVVCISKSGRTIETISQYFLVRFWFENILGSAWREHFIVVTDTAKGYLREEAARHDLLAMPVPDNLGGRYSALSAVGLLPAAFLGIDWKALLDGAASVAQPLVESPKYLAWHPSFALARWALALEQHDYSQLIFFCYVPQWATFGPWFAQLWAESLGKQGKGIMPVPATGVTDQHSVNQMFLDGPRNKGCIFLTSKKQPQGRKFPEDIPAQWRWLAGKPFGSLLEAEALGTRMALVKNQVPLVHLEVEDTSARSAGAMMMLLEAATMFTGWLLDINPLDQPAVELGKRLANARLGAPGYEEEEKDLADFLAVEPHVQEF